MAFRVAAKPELDAHLSILWFNHLVLSFEIDQAWGSPPLPLSLLAAFTNELIGFHSGSAKEANTKLKKGFTGRIGKILDGSRCRDLDSIALFERPHRKMREYYFESEVGITTECNDVLPRRWKWLY